MNNGRVDLYGAIHKALRMVMGDTLVALGRADADDPASVAGTLAQVGRLVDFCAGHLEHEDAFVHPALAARATDWSGRTAGDHEHHAAAFAELRAGIAAVEAASGSVERGAALARLYRRVAVFVGDNFLHMEVEESENNAALWKHYSDAELIAIHQALVASLPPAAMAEAMQAILLAAAPAERAATLDMLRRSAPEPFYDAMLEAIRPRLSQQDRHKLALALDGLAEAA
ncbi:MAG: hemerythrin domain-containing protein [Alphaproteobacteria bacterium]